MMKEKATIPKRVRGTVLFTVVSVMMVLIVFLAATLALATTANRRAYTNYQQKQSEYTASAIINSFQKALNADAAKGGSMCQAIVNLGANTSTSFDVTIDDGSSSPEVRPVIVMDTGEKRSYYDSSTNQFEDMKIYCISVTVDSRTTNASATYESFVGLAMEETRTNNPPKVTTTVPDDGGAFVSLNDMDGHEVGVHGYTTGGSYVGIGIPGSGGDYTIGRNEMTIDSTLYVNGNLNATNHFYVHFTKPNDFMHVQGNLDLSVNEMHIDFTGYNPAGSYTTGAYDYNTTPFLYVDGVLKAQNQQFLGEVQRPVNFYVGSMDLATGNGKTFVGDIYMMDKDVESKIGNTGGKQVLYDWANGTFDRTNIYVDEDDNEIITTMNNTTYGNMYSMGSILFQIVGDGGIEIGGNVQVKQNMTITNSGGNGWGMTVNGDIYVEGKLTLPYWTKLTCNGSIYANEIELGSKAEIVCNSVNTVNPIVGGSEAKISGNTSLDTTNPSVGTISLPVGVEVKSEDVTSETYFVAYGADESVPSVPDYLPNSTGNAWWWQVKVCGRLIENGNAKDYGRNDGYSREYADCFTSDNCGNYSGYASAEDYLMNAPEDVVNQYPMIKIYRAMVSGTILSETKTVVSCSLDNIIVNGVNIQTEVYPMAYTREGLDKTKLEHPKDVPYDTMYPIEFNDLDDTIVDKAAREYKLDRYSPGASPSAEYGLATGQQDLNANALRGGNTSGHYTINKSCVLSGSFSDNIYIDTGVVGETGSGSITVILENVSLDNQKSIIVNDSYQVTLVVIGQFKLAQSCCLITKDYMKIFTGNDDWNDLDGNCLNQTNGGTASIPQQVWREDQLKYYPNVVIHSVPPTNDFYTPDIGSIDHPSTLVHGQSMMYHNTDCIVTALVRAPQMIYMAGSGNRSIGQLNYVLPTNINVDDVRYGDNYNVGEANKVLGLIGQLVAGSIRIYGAGGEWGMLFVVDKTHDPDAPDPDLDPDPDPDDPDGETIKRATLKMLYTNVY